MSFFRSAILGAILAAAPLSAAHAQQSSDDGRNRNLTIYNSSSKDVYHVYFGRPDMEYYSRDLLGSEILDAGENIRLDIDNGRGDCTFKLKATTAGDSDVWEKTLNVCTESSWTLVDRGGGGSGGNRTITIYNNSDYRIYKIHFGLPGREIYDRDLLGSNVIAPHDSLSIEVDNGRGDCTFALKAETESAATTWERTLNVCTENSWTLTN